MSPTDALERALLDHGDVSPEQLARARRVCGETGDRLDVVLTRLGLASEQTIAAALADHLRLALVGADEFPAVPVLAERLGAQFLRDARVLPLAETDAGIVLAMADPLDGYAINAVRLAAEKDVEVRVATATAIEGALDRLYGTPSETVGDIVEGAGAELQTTEEDIARLRDMASEAPVVRLVSLLINKAVDMGASDIHIEPFEKELKVRFRIDGVLSEMEAPPLALRPAIASRIKLMARLNIAESRLPQDGRIQVNVQGREIDLRVSTVPTLYGESIVLRLLDRGSIALELPALGFTDAALQAYLTVLDQPTGILLVTGPTGSGKTTTLYSSLVRLNTGDRKIMTVEDPVEYHLDGVNQVQVRPQIGLNFADALRSLLRQDPDIMMIGEIRDLETAEIAVQAALTGHKVLSTLHTNNAASTVTRLLDMGVEDYLLTSTINGIVAQRLVRRICDGCRAPKPLLPEIVDELGLDRFFGGGEPVLSAGTGCAACNGTGYRGRTGIIEILAMSDAVRKAVVRRASTHDIQSAACDGGMITMFEDGMSKVVAGVTTLEEILRVTREG
ncbi:MAG: type II secretion system ATPase GspE [Alphaproteobacteria bacterium]|nr:type II secretion system ATPase GspE [Alphaproteobacteria bacterium]